MELDLILSDIQSLIQSLMYLVISLFVILLMKGSDDCEEQENEENKGQENIQSDCSE